MQSLHHHPQALTRPSSPSLRHPFAPTAFWPPTRVFLDCCRRQPAGPCPALPRSGFGLPPVKTREYSLALDTFHAANTTRNPRTARNTHVAVAEHRMHNGTKPRWPSTAVADIAHEDRPQHARAPHHLPYAQDPPADDSAEPHGRPGAGAVLPTGVVSDMYLGDTIHRVVTFCLLN